LSGRNILVTGGAGYIGSVLVPQLLQQGERVTVLDVFFYGHDTLPDSPDLTRVDLDLRDHAGVDALLAGERFDAVIHLAAISNDPSSDLDPELTRQVNLDGTRALMESAQRHGVGRFLYASSASVYGIKEVPDVTEDLDLEPITIYAKYKAEGEAILNALTSPDFVGVSVRAATVCGWSPRLRLDLTINILTLSALTRGEITVFGGQQMRPNIHVQDLALFYRPFHDMDEAQLVAGCIAGFSDQMLPSPRAH
jgi:nucleoside-diphosphate-sugar epimerase